MSTTTRTVITEVRDLLAWPGSDQVITDTELEGFIFKHIGVSQSFTFTEYATGIYICTLEKDTLIYGMLFTGQDGVDYQANCTGSIKVTSGTHSEDTITVTGCLVWLRPLMVELLQFIATHKALEPSVNVPMGTYTPRTSKEILDMADAWMGITAG